MPSKPRSTLQIAATSRNWALVRIAAARNVGSDYLSGRLKHKHDLLCNKMVHSVCVAYAKFKKQYKQCGGNIQSLPKILFARQFQADKNNKFFSYAK